MESAEEQESEQDFGYDIELFVNAPDPEFICTICHGVLKGPVELSCQHVFCKGCISSWLVRKKVKGVTRSVIPMIHNMIGRLIMKCENKIYGCRYTFPLEQYEKHKAACEYRIVSCRYEGCATEMFHKNIAAHEQVCEHWNQPCRMGCGVQLTRNQLEEHNCYRDTKRKYKGKITVLKRRLSCMHHRLKLVEEILQNLTADNHLQLLESCVCEDAGESENITDGVMDEAQHTNEDSISISSTSSIEQESSLYGNNTHLYFETDDVNENTASQTANTSISQSAAVKKKHRPWILHSLRLGVSFFYRGEERKLRVTSFLHPVTSCCARILNGIRISSMVSGFVNDIIAEQV
ncbi:RING finger protein 151 isoform X2 [Hypanus sabinus]|uniref:RING finger protein 151 isoform X2 n=1 Tax=Hypanus sabinus TaxID=79690 RepID=UPI0028C4D34F|nr:RING finger protein 151 isoform X2 [Hypanus sabinus]